MPPVKALQERQQIGSDAEGAFSPELDHLKLWDGLPIKVFQMHQWAKRVHVVHCLASL
jgi:hypothetical protein